MSDYISLTNLKAAIGLPSTDLTDDGVLNNVIFRASAYVDEYLRQCRPGFVGFAAASNAHTVASAVGSNTRTYDGTGTDTLFIDDAASVATVVVDSTTVAATDYVIWPYNEVPKRALIYEEPTAPVYGTVSHWTRGKANITVTGYWGLPYVPDDIAQTTLAVALILWRRYQKGDYTGSSATLNSQRFSYGGGRQFQYIVDPEISAALSLLEPGWAVPGVWGG